MKGSLLTPVSLGLAWMVSLGAAFLLGMLAAFALHLKPEAVVASELSPVEREAAAIAAQFLDEPLDWGTLKSYSPRNRVPPQVELLMEKFSEQPTRAERRAITARFSRVLPQSKVGALVEGLTDREDPPADVIWGLLHTWSGSDLVTARAFLEATIKAGRLDPEMASALEPE